MAFLAPLIPEIASLASPALLSLAEQAGASLVGKEALQGVKKLANMAITHGTKEVSPAKLLKKLVDRGAKVLQDPEKLQNVIDKSGKVLDLAAGGANKFSGVLGKAGVLTPEQVAKFRHGLGNRNMQFHGALGKLAKVQGHLLPFLQRVHAQ